MTATQSPTIRTERLLADLSRLAQFGGTEDGGVDRPTFSPAYRQAIDWLSGRMHDAGLSVRMDAAGNLIGRLGPDDGPAVVCGSHIDSVPGGGKYDGTLGVVAGLEVARSFTERNLRLDRALEVIAFADEEGAYLSLLGARAMMGDLGLEEIATCLGRDGNPLSSVMTDFGLAPTHIAEAARPREDFAAYLELHIEQGPVLESRGIDIGVVESIVGLQRSEFLFEGQAGHAGTTPVALRHDALRAASETIVESFAVLEAEFHADLRLTYGSLEVEPGVSNVVPATVRLGQEIRAAEKCDIDALHERTRTIAKTAGRRHDVKLRTQVLSLDPSAHMSPAIVSKIVVCCDEMGLPHLRMPSGAGHDAQAMANVCDTGMIFVPSREGLSHNPAEETSERHIELGANVLVRVLEGLVCRG